MPKHKLNAVQREGLYQSRAERLVFLLTYNGPRVLIEQECLLLLSTYGIFPPLRHKILTQIHSWFVWKWIQIWHKGILGKTDADIAAELEKGF